ncbi:putative SP-containing protein [Vairimorpha necatrix]|uniref:SP-containing protein n=1 Tax=Vairimorpha necatrix TaxID=6039 RepID=A0AAX4JFG9_9MICR
MNVLYILSILLSVKALGEETKVGMSTSGGTDGNGTAANPATTPVDGPEKSTGGDDNPVENLSPNPTSSAYIIDFQNSLYIACFLSVLNFLLLILILFKIY